MFTTHWELKVFFSSLRVPNPKPTEEYGIFCADFTPALNSSPLERIGIPARDPSRDQSCCIHRQRGPALQVPQGTLPSTVFHPVLYFRATHLGFSMDSRVCWEVPEWIPPRMGSSARSCLGSTQLSAHSAGWQPAPGHWQGSALAISITQPLQRLQLDFPRGNGLEQISD